MTGRQLRAARTVLYAGLRWLCYTLATYGALYLGRPEIAKAVLEPRKPRAPRPYGPRVPGPGSPRTHRFAGAEAGQPGRGGLRLDGPPPDGPEQLLPGQLVSDLEQFVLRELSQADGSGSEVDSY